MNILITGGTGLIGRALICQLALDKHNITVLFPVRHRKSTLISVMKWRVGRI